MNFYTIQLSRRGGQCIATIPELCISVEAESPELALANILSKETETIEMLHSASIPLPSPIDKISSFPRISEALYNSAVFFGKSAAVYLIFLFLSVVIAATIFSPLKQRIISAGREYINSPATKESTQKVLKQLGISISIDSLNTHSVDSIPVLK